MMELLKRNWLTDDQMIKELVDIDYMMKNDDGVRSNWAFWVFLLHTLCTHTVIYIYTCIYTVGVDIVCRLYLIIKKLGVIDSLRKS